MLVKPEPLSSCHWYWVAPGIALKTMVSPRTKIDNLFLTGQTVNMHGILGVTIGAFNTCAEILGKGLIDDRLKKMDTKSDKES